MKANRHILHCLATILILLIWGCAKKNENNTISNNNNNLIPECPPAFTDVDGNTYTTIKIGNQCWTLENLKTTRFNDSTTIATGLTASQWENTTSGAYEIYEDSIPLGNTYGKLYNGYAAASGKLCPKGWRIPTDEDFKTLEKHLGLPEAEVNNTGERGAAEGIGLKLKSTILWNTSSHPGNNSSAYTALPAGTRNSVGDYITLQQYAVFWTSTPYATDTNYLWNHHLYYNGPGVSRIYETKNRGYSCRCIKE